MRVVKVLGVVLIVLGLGAGWSGPARLALFGPAPTLRLEPVAAPAVRRSGRLTWREGFRLSGHDAAFGGFSALAVRRAGAGHRILLLGDGGNLVGFALGEGGQPRDARFGELPGGPRSGWEKRDRDAESITLDPAGRAWVGFESANAIWRYAPGLGAAERGVRPRAMRRWATNGSLESLVRLRDGRFVAIAESAGWPGSKGGRAGIVFAGDPVAHPHRGYRFTYRPAAGFDPVDIAQLPDGDLLVLERQWLLPARFRSRLAVVRRAALAPGARVAGREVGRIAPPWPTENFEGVAVTREGPATIVWLVSDDDRMPLRRSYLLKLRLDPETATARRSGGATGRRMP